MDHFRRTAAGIFANDWVAAFLSRFVPRNEDAPEPPPPFEAPPPGLGIPEVANLAIETMGGLITRYRLAALPPDVLVTIPNDSARSLDFHRAAELIELGRNATRAALDASFPQEHEPEGPRELTP